jgi:maleate isomerase
MDAGTNFTDLGVLPCTLDEGIAARAAIGLLVLATDQTMEHEFRQLIRLPGVAVYAARLFNDAAITPDTLRAMRDRIAPAAALILPDMHLDVVAFGCTSASMTLGEDEVFRQIRRARPEVACTTPVTAAFAAFKALGARRIGVLTPYAPDVNAVVRAYLDTHGADVAAFATFDKRDDREAARISVASITDGARCEPGCGVRVLHQPAAGRACRGDRGGGRRARYVQRSCAGLALPAPGGCGRHRAGRRAAVQMRHRLMTPSGSRHS